VAKESATIHGRDRGVIGPDSEPVEPLDWPDLDAGNELLSLVMDQRSPQNMVDQQVTQA
jgi:hypothetical protein